RNLYDELIKIRDEQRQEKENAVFVVDGEDLPWEVNPQGIMRWYTHPEIKDTATRSLLVYVQKILPESRSGLLKFQGGQVIYFMEGKGHTVIDGVNFHWEAGDVLQLPMRWDGVVHQHFNDDPKTEAQLLCVQANFIHALGVDRGSGFEQLAACPEYQEKQKAVRKKND
ncbi:MAG: hypothetical protein HYY30_04650, partial [Chloroflexi bacterium]|nr:hypothetical protein [Chloroflexota bacterium]